MNVENICKKSIISVANGDMGALSPLYDCMARLIFSYAFSIVGNAHDAEDVLQDAFIHISRGASDYNPALGAKAWVMAIAKNLSFDLLRRRSHAASDDIDDMEDAAEYREEFIGIEVREMLSSLEMDERQIVNLKIVVGLPYKEIARIFNITPGTAQKRYSRAIEKLKKL